MRKLYLLICSLFACTLIFGQNAANYAFSTGNTGSLVLDKDGNAIDMSTGTTLLYGPNVDTYTNPGLQNFGFTFWFMGTPYTTWNANPDGQVRLGTSLLTGHTSFATAGIPMLVANNIDARTGVGTGKVHYKVQGSAPNRVLVIEWADLLLNWSATGTTLSTFQMRLYENGGVIEYVYGQMWNSSTSAQTNSIGFASGSTAGTVGQVLTIATTPTYSATATSFTSTSFPASSAMANLHSTSDGSRTVFTFTPPAAPAAPTNLTFSAITASSITLNWVDNAPDESGYQIFRSTDGVNFTLVGTVPANTVSTTVSGLMGGTNYFFRVIAFTEGGGSAPLTGSQATNNGTLTGTRTVGAGGDYPNLTTAFADINANGLSGNLILQLIAGYPASPETYPIVSSGAVVGNFTVTIYPTVSGLSITSNNATGTLQFNAARNIILDGRINGTGTAKNLVVENTSTTGYAIQFINDANNNTIRYNVIRGVNTSTTSGVVVFGTAASGTVGNSNNTIDNNDIRDGATTPSNGIYGAGTAAVPNAGNIISNNNIFNFFNASGASNGINAATASTGWTITGNHFYQTANRTHTTGATHAGILINNSSGTGFTISNNFIGGGAPGAGGSPWTIAGNVANRFRGISLSVGTGTATSVQGNTITNFNFTSNSSASTAGGPWAGIYLLAGDANIGTVTGNTIGSGTGNGAITLTAITNSGGLSTGIFADPSPTVANIANNTIGSVTITAGTISSGFQGIAVTSASSASTVTIQNNTIGSLTTANSIHANTGSTSTTNQLVRGIFNSSSASITIANNTVANLTNNYLPSSAGTSNTMTGILSSGGINTITGNTVRNLTTAANATGTGSASSVIGIAMTSTATGSNTVSQNTVFNLSQTHASAAVNVAGLVVSGSTTGPTLVARNFIYNLNAVSSSTSAALLGISQAGGQASIQNNMVRLGLFDNAGTVASVTAGLIIIGIDKNTSSNSNIYHNSVFIGGSGVTPGTANTMALRRNTAGTDDIRNNILVNQRSGTGKHYAIGLVSNATLTLSNNIYHGTGTGFNLGYVGATDYPLFDAAWSTASGDAGSLFGNPQFVNTVTLTPDLHVQTGTNAEGTGVAIASVTDDFDGQARAGLSPTDIGADAGDYGLAGVDVGVQSLVSPSATGCYTANEAVTVSLRNFGSSVIDFSVSPVTITVNVTGTATQTLTTVVNTGTLAAGSSQNVTLPGTLNMSISGIYNFAANAAASGDVNPANNAMTPASRTVIAPQVLPQSIDFTGFTGANLTSVFANWSEASGATLPVGTTGNWTSSTLLGLPGNTSARINLIGNTKRDWIVGPKFVPTSNTRLRFDVAITDAGLATADPAGMQGTDDKVIIRVSNNCGVSWTDLATFDAANTTSISNSFVPQNVDLSAYAGQELIVAFFATEGTADDAPSYDFHIDNVDILNATTADVGLFNLAAPLNNTCYAASEPVTVIVKNFGLNTIDLTATPVTVTVNVTGTITATLTGTLNTGSLVPGATANITMSSPLNMAAAGAYNLNIAVSMTGDGNAGNNSLPTITRNVAALPQNVNFTGFTGSNLNTVFPNWNEGAGAAAPAGTTSLWASSTAFTGDTTARINLFTANRNEWIYGPGVNATAQTELRMNVAITNFASSAADPEGMQGTDDKVIVRVSANCGASWTDVFTFDASNTASISNTEVPVTIPLGGFAGQRIVVGIYASDGPTDDAPDYDFHVDDISIADVPPCTGATGGTATTATTTFCGTGSFTINASGFSTGSGSTYQWQSSTNGGTTWSIITGATNPASLSVTNLTATTQYRLRVTCPSGTLEAFSNVSTITINPLPSITLSTGTFVSLCGGTPVSMTASGADNYSWAPATGLSTTTGATVIASPSNPTVYTITGTNTTTGCNGTATVTVTPAPAIDATASAAQTSVCSNIPVQLSSAASGSWTSLRITEVTLFRTGTGATSPYPASMPGADLVEISNLSTTPINAGGLQFQVWTGTTLSRSFFVPGGTVIPANGVMVLHLGTGTDDAASRYFNIGGTNDAISSTTAAGFVLRGNVIIDAVGTNSYAFPPASGVTAADWSGNIASTSGLAGVIRSAAVDNNSAADWSLSSATNVQTIGAYNNAANYAAVAGSYSFNWSPAFGLSSATIANPVATTSSNISYVVTVTDQATGCLDTAQVHLILAPSPMINTQPVPQTVCTGGTASFSVAATGSGLTYQWQRRGVDIPGATGTTLTINNVAAADSGMYRVIITFACGSNGSDSVRLTVNQPPAIATQPQSQTVCAGTNVSFTVAATGAGLTYQWRKGGVNITGATSATLTLNNVTAADAASYDVVVSGTCAPSVTSSAATLTLTANPVITTQPANVSACVGSSATLTVAATGSSLTYQWRKGGVNIAGATSASYTINNLAAGDGGNYDVVIGSSCGSATSTVASITVNSRPVSSFTVPATVCAGVTVNFTNTSTVAGSTISSSSWTFGNGNTSTSQNPATIFATPGVYSVKLVVTSGAGCIDSVTQAVTVTGAPTITTQPLAQTVCAGSAANFTVAASGSGLTYQWRRGGVNITGATNASYTIAAATAADAANYDVVVTGPCGNITSSAVALTVNAAPAITTQPASQTICPGSNLTLTVVATGTGLSYQWRKGGTNITGATSASYTINNVVAGDAGSYDVVVSGTCTPGATSAAATVTVAAANSWIGTASTAWNNAANWCGGIPTATSDITIPAGTPFSPSISTTQDVRNLTISTGATVTVAAGGRLNVHGNFTNSGTFTATAGTVAFQGSSNQSVAAMNAGTVIMNGTGGITLSGPMTAGMLTLTNGNITLGTHNLNLGSSTSGSVASHIITNATGGVVVSNVGTTAVTIPVGGDANSYNPVTLANGDGRTYTVGVGNGIGPVAIANNNLAVNRTWVIVPNTAPTAPVNVTLQYADAEMNAGGNGSAIMQAGVYNGTLWAIASPAAGIMPTGTATARQASLNLSLFGPLVLANPGGFAYPTAVPNVDADVTGAQLLPNRIESQTTLRVDVRRNMRLDFQLVDGKGNVVMQFSRQLTAGRNDFRLSLGHLANGTYYLQGSNTKGRVVSLRMIRL